MRTDVAAAVRRQELVPLTGENAPGNPRGHKNTNKIPRDRDEVPSSKGSLAARAQRPTRRSNRKGERPVQATNAALARLAVEVQSRISECTIGAADKEKADRCVKELQATATKLGPEWRIRLFGSVVNGFGTKNSDIDASFLREDPGRAAAPGEPQEPVQAASLLKEKLIPLLREHPQFEILDEILGAKVPILKLRFNNCLDVDLSCQNLQPFQNTQLLQAYASLDQRVRDLGIAVKLWAKAAGICGAVRGHLSSYTFTLLAIYFMQVHNDVRLPCLPPTAMANSQIREAKIRAARSMWTCRLTLSELLWRFFAFYAQEFVWGYEVVSVRWGHKRHTNEQFFKDLRGRWAVRLHVEDPYQVERNLHCVLGEAEEVMLRQTFQTTWFNLCLDGKIPVGLGVVRHSPEPEPVREVKSEVVAGASRPLATAPIAAASTATPPPSSPEVGPLPPPPPPPPECQPRLLLDSAQDGVGWKESDLGARPRPLNISSFLEVPSAGDSAGGSTTASGAPSSPPESTFESSGDEKHLSDNKVAGAPQQSVASPQPKHFLLSPLEHKRSSTLSSDEAEGEQRAALPQEDGKGTMQWWRHIDSPTVAAAIRKRVPRTVESIERTAAQLPAQARTVQDLEGSIVCCPGLDLPVQGQDTGHHPGECDDDKVGGAVRPLIVRSFSSRTTSVVAARVARLCSVQVRYQ